MHLPDLRQIESAAEVIYQHLQPTPQINWPLLSEAAGCEVWVKHEDVNPTGAFKVRGGIYYLSHLSAERPDIKGVISATRGNHGQSIGYAAAMVGIHAVIVVPHGNSEAKNKAMKALGVELIEHGADFNESLDYAKALAEDRHLHLIPSFAPELVAGVATYSLEFLRAQTLDQVYVPVGMGSGICGMMAAKAALGVETEVIGVVAEQANAYQLSFDAKAPISTNSANTIADGLAVRKPDPDALNAILDGVGRIVSVSEEQVQGAIRTIFETTHHVAEGAGAATVAALIKEKEQNMGRKVGVVLSGANIDVPLFLASLQQN